MNNDYTCFSNFYRCFTFGIGSGASSALVEGMAAAGGGTAEFVKEGERLQPKVRHCESKEASTFMIIIICILLGYQEFEACITAFAL